jgi:ADP-heptose:LPS heptosyltransferase
MKRNMGKRVGDILYTLFLRSNFKSGNKVLITSTDGIGDFIVREKIFTKLVEEYGKENIVVLAKEKLCPLLKKMGIENIIIYTDKKRKKFAGRVELFKELNEVGIKKIISLEFDQHDSFIKHFPQVEKIGFNNVCHSEMDKYYDTLIPYTSGSIINDVLSFYKNYFKEEITFEQGRPYIGNLFEIDERYRDCIAVGIGSMDRRKMLAPKIFAEVIKTLRERYPEKKMVLLGKGKLEERFMQELQEQIDLTGIEDLVNKVSLDKTMEVIKSSEIYIGLDSGLYNFSFALGKKMVGIFTEINRFSHMGFDGIEVITSQEEGEENYFGNPKINGVAPEQILERVGEILWRDEI